MDDGFIEYSNQSKGRCDGCCDCRIIQANGGWQGMKTRERKALDIACKWLEQAGACKRYSGYICDKEFSKDGVCAKCLAQHFLRLARKAEEGE